jgi:hypothetical protein
MLIKTKGSLPRNVLEGALIERTCVTEYGFELWARMPSGQRLKFSYDVQPVSRYGEDGWDTVINIKETR